MKVKASNRFFDLKEDVMREKGDVFVCTAQRFAELEENLPSGYVEKVAEAPKKAPAKKAAK